MGGQVEAVLFDLDDTVCEYRRTSEEVLALACDAVGVEPFFTREEYYALYDDLIEDGGSVDAVRERCFARLAERAGRDPETGRALARAYAAERNQTDVRFLPGARDAVEGLADSYAVGAVTNGNPDLQSRKIAGLGIDDHFETVVYAGYDTAAKPDPEPFRVALDDLKVPPERSVAVGNSLRTDIMGAHAAGARSVWLEQDGIEDPDPEPHYRVETMRDLLDEPWA